MRSNIKYSLYYFKQYKSNIIYKRDIYFSRYIILNTLNKFGKITIIIITAIIIIIIQLYLYSGGGAGGSSTNKFTQMY
jgi:hypothetical protein